MYCFVLAGNHFSSGVVDIAPERYSGDPGSIPGEGKLPCLQLKDVIFSVCYQVRVANFVIKPKT